MFTRAFIKKVIKAHGRALCEFQAERVDLGDISDYEMLVRVQDILNNPNEHKWSTQT